jgi:hypothetical protein
MMDINSRHGDMRDEDLIAKSRALWHFDVLTGVLGYRMAGGGLHTRGIYEVARVSLENS